MEIYAYKVFEDAKDLFNADKLIQVAAATKSSRTGNWYHHRNKTPGTSLFNRMEVFPLSATEFQLVRYGKPRAFMETTDQGATWRYYNKPTREEATRIVLLVEGDPDVDLYHANPGVRIEQEQIGTGKDVKTLATIHNISLINEKPWQEAKNNVDIQGIGCMWYMRRVHDLHYKQGGYIACGNKVDMNRGSGRVAWCKITDDPTVPLTTDFKSDAELNEFKTDYIYTEKDQLDPDKEYLSLILYHGVKQTLYPITIPMTTIL